MKRKLLLLLCSLALQGIAEMQTFAATFVVTTISDNAGGTNPAVGAGTGTLRQAIIDANNTAAADVIEFNVAGTGVKTLTLNALLPLITRPLTIDGYSQGTASPGAIGSRNILIEINGNSQSAGGGRSGSNSDDGLFRFTANADGSSISGLSIYNTGSSVEAILVEPGITGMHIWGNYIGVLANGNSPASAADYNGDDGILLGEYSANSGSFSSVFVGTNGDGINDVNEGNVISNSADAINGGDGIQVGTDNGAYTWTDTRISGNYIGIEANGLTAAGNGILSPGVSTPFGGDGINVRSESNILIGSEGNGTSDVAERNIISGNFGNGIGVVASTLINIAGNYVGTDKLGTTAVANGKNSNAAVPYTGILVLDNSVCVIGFNDAVHVAVVASDVRNIISGNYGIGVQFFNGTSGGNRISGNYVGVDATGNKALGNGQANNGADNLFSVGIDVTTRPGVLVGTDGDGDDDILERNIVSGNMGTGIYIRSASHNCIVAGNYVGVGADGVAVVGNDFVGVRLDDVNNTRVGSDDNGLSDEQEANIIANNAHASYTTTSDGLRITGNAVNNRLSRNSYYNNRSTPIDLSNDAVTVNDGLTTAGSPNVLLDYPVITSYSVSGNTVTVSGYVGNCNGIENQAGTTISGALTIQLYKSFNDGDQNAAISSNGCARVVSHGEGGMYLGSILVTGGKFVNQTFSLVAGATFTSNDLITGITIDGSGNTSEFGVVTYIRISGTVWNDADANIMQNGTESGTNAGGALFVNLVNSAGGIVSSASVAADGSYLLDGPSNTSGLILVLSTSATATGPGTLPSGWSNTGENVGADNSATQSGILSQIELTTASTDVTLQNFGIKSTPLPVTLSKFILVRESKRANVIWTTTQESNADRFDVERSTNAKEWLVIGTKMARGESKAVVNYYLTDESPADGINYYRLKMIDKDGTYAYSRIQSLNFEYNNLSIAVYPNPVSEVLFLTDVKMEAVKQIRIVNTSGRVVYHSDYVSSAGINVHSLSAGIYLLNVVLSDGKKHVCKFVIQK